MLKWGKRRDFLSGPPLFRPEKLCLATIPWRKRGARGEVKLRARTHRALFQVINPTAPLIPLLDQKSRQSFQLDRVKEGDFRSLLLPARKFLLPQKPDRLPPRKFLLPQKLAQLPARNLQLPQKYPLLPARPNPIPPGQKKN